MLNPQTHLDTIVAEVEALSFGGSKMRIMEAVNKLADDLGLYRYEYRVVIATGLTERVPQDELV